MCVCAKSEAARLKPQSTVELHYKVHRGNQGYMVRYNQIMKIFVQKAFTSQAQVKNHTNENTPLYTLASIHLS